MEMKIWSIADSYQDQIQAIASWCTNPFLLDSILTAGHSDVHFVGADKYIKDIDACVDAMYQSDDIADILPAHDITAAEASRVATEIVPSSHFTSKEVMLGALSATLLGAAHNINKWLTGDVMCRTTFQLTLHVDMDTFIGTGIEMDGNERATTVATLVLTRIPSYVDRFKIPFSIKTMYPNITDRTDVGTVVQTGRNFGIEVMRAINEGDIASQMYWQLKERGEDVTMSKGSPRAAVLHGCCNGIEYSVLYNERSYGHGYLLIHEPGSDRPVPAARSTLSPETIQELRQDEYRRIGNSLNKAWSSSRLSITSTEQLFPEKEAEVLRANRSNCIEEVFDENR